jgi:hypothetical protein
VLETHGLPLLKVNGKEYALGAVAWVQGATADEED